jgi:iron(III) transport system substrate-binding protein
MTEVRGSIARNAMPDRDLSRRDVIKASTALAASTLFAEPLKAAAPEPSAITPALVAAAKREGKVVYYTSIDLPVSEQLARTFEAKFPGLSVRVERSGAERVFQRIGQEYASNIHAVDVVNSSDASHFIVWKRDGLLAPFVPEDVARHYPAERKDPDGLFAGFRAGLNLIGYNTDLVKAQDAPRSFADLLDPRWSGRLVKAHPGYSGSIMTATFEMARDLGWGYFERLARQRVLQVQSATDPSKKIALGERAVMVDGNEHNLIQIKESGGPVDIVYPLEGTPLAVGPNGLFNAAPNPNAARLFQCFCFTAECQQMVSDFGALRSFHPQVKEKGGRKPFREIKTMQEDAAAVEKMSDEIKARYARLFGV